MVDVVDLAAAVLEVVQHLDDGQDVLAARALGLGAVLTTPHFFVPGTFEAILGIPKTVTLAAIVPVGYPLGNFGPVKRPPASAVVSWDRFKG